MRNAYHAGRPVAGPAADRPLTGDAGGRRPAFLAIVMLGFGIVASVSACTRDATADADPGVATNAVVQILRNSLPAGEISQLTQTGPEGLRDAGPPSASVVFDDGHGPAEVRADVARLPVPVSAEHAGCPDRAHHPFDHCTSRVLPDGSTLVWDEGYAVAVERTGLKRWAAVLTRTDGGQVAVTQWNAPAEDGAVATRTLPPLTEAQLVSAVSRPDWNTVLAAMDAPPRAVPRPAAPELTTSAILSTVRTSLPTGMRTASAEGAERGYVDLTLDDGAGVALLAVTVQRWSPGDRNLAEVFTGAQTRPGGTRIAVRQNASPDGGAGAVQWDVDLLRHDGRRVLISELNASAYGLPASRPSPPLSLEQLASMADSVMAAG